MSNKIIIHADVKSLEDELSLSESLQQLANNITVENLKLLADKSQKPGINKKIQTYKNFM